MAQLIKFIILSIITLLIASGALFIGVEFVVWHGGNIVSAIVTVVLYASVILMLAGMVIAYNYHNYKMFKLYGR